MNAAAIALLFVAVVIGVFLKVTERNRKRIQWDMMNQADRNDLSDRHFRIMNEAVYQDKALYVDGISRYFAIRRDEYTPCALFKIDALRDFEFVETGVGEAGRSGGSVVSGVRFSEGAKDLPKLSPGAIGICRSLQIRVYVNDFQNPEIVYWFIDHKTKRTEFAYKLALQDAKRFYALLVSIAESRIQL